MGKNAYFQFKKFSVDFSESVFPVGTDACLLGAFIVQQKRRVREPVCMDVGCGSGVLALFAAVHLHAFCYAIDINPQAVIQCLSNFKKMDLEQSLSADCKSLNEALLDMPQNALDIVCCNPPYFLGLKHAQSPKEQARHSAEHFDAVALFALANKSLKTDGELCLIIPVDQFEKFCRHADNHGLTHVKTAWIKGHYQSPSKRCILSFTKTKDVIYTEEMLVIESKRGQYSTKAKRWFAPYYLKC